MSDKLPIPEIILASTSPRRKHLFEQVGIPFRIISPTVEEIAFDNDPAASALHNAEIKTRSVVNLAGGSPVLGADTVVDIDGEPVGKPVDAADAIRMLTRLSGRKHFVHTGVCLIDPSTDREWSAVEESVVWFRKLGWREIEAYVATGEPMDKAGAYGIQARGAMLIERIDGCFFNVMGLPLARVWLLIKEMMAARGTTLDGW